MVELGHVGGNVRAAHRSGALTLLLTCAVVVPALLGAYQQHLSGAPGFTDDKWDLDADRSYVELLGYAFMAAAALLLLGLHLRRHAPVYAGWAAGLVLLIADDALGLHERAGVWLDSNLDVIDPPGLRVVDLGELAFWAGTGAAMSAVLYLTHRRSCPSAQRHSYSLVALLALLAVFAVGVDMLHIVVKSLLDEYRVNAVLIAVEAAGELGAMAGLAAYAIHVSRRPTGPDPISVRPASAAPPAPRAAAGPSGRRAVPPPGRTAG